ncbi:MAG: response regulator transcription factor [Anaerolineae bacterium]|nr:response regulator transcription factor [Anaerolineae bacterium]
MIDQDTIRVLIVDDHKMIRKGLRTFLAAYQDLKLVGEASTGEEAVLICPEVEPDVVIMDINLPEIDGIEATKRILATYPHCNVLVLTGFTGDDLIQSSIAAGAVGYLLKDIDADVLANAIRSAYVGRATLAPGVIQALTAQADTLGDDLTKRERQVLKLIADGLTNAEIAQNLEVRLSTVKFHVSNIMGKLSVGTRTEIATTALRHNMLNQTIESESHDN